MAIYKTNYSHTQEKPDTGNPEIGRKIKEYRLLRGLRQQDLGDKVGSANTKI